MLSFNVLFTHKITYLQLSICRRENEWGSAPFILLYLSLTIWIANRTIYHGVVIYFMLAAQVSLPLIYGNTLYIMKFNKSFGVSMGKPSCRTSKTLAALFLFFFQEANDSLLILRLQLMKYSSSPCLCCKGIVWGFSAVDQRLGWSLVT